MQEYKLKNYFSKWQRVQELRAEIRTAYDTRQSIDTAAQYTGSKHRNRSGPIPEAIDRLEKLRADLAAAEDDFYSDCEEIESWLLTVPDLETVAIIRWHFLLGRSWPETNQKVYGRRDYCFSRAKYLRFAENNLEHDEEPAA